MKPTSYSLSGYGRMIIDRPRMDAYVQALKHAIQPGDVVLDIGTGTGIFALLACQFGASKVYAIDPSDAIQVGKEIAIANGYGDRIEFIQDISTNIHLPEAVQVIVSDLRSVLPLFQHHINAIVDARQRFLAPNGILIPQCDQLWVSIITAPDFYQPYTSPWIESPYGINLQATHRFVTNAWKRIAIKPEHLLLKPQCSDTLHYSTISTPNYRTTLNWSVDREGTVHGIGIWFDTTLFEESGFSNAPDQPELIYGNAFFPFSQPINLLPGDSLSLQLRANLVGDDYVWSWKTKVLEQGDPVHIKAHFQQSTFFGEPRSPQQLQQQSDRFVPTLNETGKIDHLILTLMEQSQSLGAIAQQLAAQFPQRFPTHQVALTHVSELSQRYSES